MKIDPFDKLRINAEQSRRIDGKAIAEKIYADVYERVQELKNIGITPILSVILIGDDPGSVTYVSQKEKHAEKLGITLQLNRLPKTVTEDQLSALIRSYNADPSIHGIIIQRPAPEQITKSFLDEAVIPEKDVDGFHPNSDFAAPVALAVERILYEVYKETQETDETKQNYTSVSFDSFVEWLRSQHIVVLGKGLTAGTPIISHFHNRSATVSVIDSQTENPLEILGDADIVISAVGKKDILTPGMMKLETILIGVGLHTEDGELRGDYSEAEIEGNVRFYTSTPGGVGPVNVAMLMENVTRAAEEQTGNE